MPNLGLEIGIHPSLLGFAVAGDLASVTLWTTRYGKVTGMLKAPPDKPASPEQVNQRARFSTAMTNWSALTKAQKSDWGTMAKRTGCRAHGINVAISYMLLNLPLYIDTLERQSGITVTRPAIVT